MTDIEINLAKESLKQFGITGSLRRVATGLDQTYRVKANDGRVFALRVSSGMPIRRVSAFAVEAAWIDALDSNDWFAVPQVQKTERGERFAQVEDRVGIVRASTLLSWLPGRRCFQPKAKHARVMGQMTGALHQSAKHSVTPAADAIKTWDARFMCFMDSSHIEGRSVHPPKIADMVQRIYLGLEEVVASLDPQEIGLINADLGLHNVVWHRGQAGLVDFNDAGVGPYAFCLGRLVGRFRKGEYGQVLVDEILNGYRDVIPLPSVYEEWGNLFELAADIFKLNYRARRAIHRSTPLRESELHIRRSLPDKLKQLGL
ncbi:MAG: phosphotransferase [Chloroflexota bacterium]